jgi:hypothetical protein
VSWLLFLFPGDGPDNGKQRRHRENADIKDPFTPPREKNPPLLARI